MLDVEREIVMIVDELHGVDLDRPWSATFSPVVSKLDVFYFFRHILGRLPAETEWRGHCGLVGKQLQDAVASYLDSPEFKARGLVHFTPTGIDSIRLDDGYIMFAATNDAIGASILTGGGYEPEVTAVFRGLLRPGMTVLDIGANIGWFTLLSAALVGATGRVIAFEPGRTNARFLALNKQANSFEQINLVLAAASDQLETLVYGSSMSNGFVTSVGPGSTESILGEDIVFGLPADMVVPDELPVHLIKVDVEGWEMKALNGSQRILERWKPHIVCEFSPPALLGASGVSGEAFLTHFRRLGYRFKAITPAGLVDHGASVEGVISAYVDARRSHIDLLMSHSSP